MHVLCAYKLLYCCKQKVNQTWSRIVTTILQSSIQYYNKSKSVNISLTYIKYNLMHIYQIDIEYLHVHIFNS